MIVKNLFISGVGGQGTILAGKVITRALIEHGFDVKMSEIHGMAQRGGSVVTQIRYGEKVYSPVIEKGKADVLLAFEKLEALRYIEYLSKEGTLIVNNLEIPPSTVLAGKEEYPQNIIEYIKNNIKNAIIIDAVSKAKELGDVRVQNIILTGALAKVMSFEKEKFLSVIKEVVPEKYKEINVRAFETGFELV
ncbi:MAG: indolepyruvate oxidoreductase subunit beta [Thermovenabulum sp.]|uniref:indolepyruvate oxidoreductase subunit beta n=1 Tax=Thermovenabulum sp. TaxID=3100335 RepID=UPI003C7CE4FE